jgi:hypothetical protein
MSENIHDNPSEYTARETSTVETSTTFNGRNCN